jgi:hypothetical protein
MEWRDFIRAQAGNELVLIELKFKWTSPPAKNSVSTAEMELTDATGATHRSAIESFDWASGDKSETESKFDIPFAVPKGVKLKSLRIGELSFDLTREEEPPAPRSVTLRNLPQLVADLSAAMPARIAAAAAMRQLAQSEARAGRRPGLTMKAAISPLEQNIVDFGRSSHPLAEACDQALRLFGDDALPSYFRILRRDDANVYLVQVAAHGIAGALANTKRIGPLGQQALNEGLPALANYASSNVGESTVMPFVNALVAIGGAAVPAIVAHLSDPAPRVRLRFVSLLARLGPKAAPALPALHKMEADTNEGVRQGVADAITKIAGAPPAKTPQQRRTPP